jgi:hypothetical protein
MRGGFTVISADHNYKVVSQRGATFVTYDDIEKARAFVKNARASIKEKLLILPNNDKTKLKEAAGTL